MESCSSIQETGKMVRAMELGFEVGSVKIIENGTEAIAARSQEPIDDLFAERVDAVMTGGSKVQEEKENATPKVFRFNPNAAEFIPKAPFLHVVISNDVDKTPDLDSNSPLSTLSGATAVTSPTSVDDIIRASRRPIQLGPGSGGIINLQGDAEAKNMSRAMAVMYYIKGDKPYYLTPYGEWFFIDESGRHVLVDSPEAPRIKQTGNSRYVNYQHQQKQFGMPQPAYGYTHQQMLPPHPQFQMPYLQFQQQTPSFMQPPPHGYVHGPNVWYPQPAYRNAMPCSYNQQPRIPQQSYQGAVYIPAESRYGNGNAMGFMDRAPEEGVTESLLRSRRAISLSHRVSWQHRWILEALVGENVI
ncbi:hypothetical protein BC829DRAFT_123344 [Chytridium lagenaria]|nr:hypothetical protein BC829DRAFT_123344 [Chytridium lagenaria]